MKHKTATKTKQTPDNALPTPNDLPFAGLIMRERKPENLEFPLATLNSFITPNERFYIRNHFDVPQLKTNEWHLKIEGAFQQPFTLSYDELLKLPSHTLTATLECAGNSRVFLTPKVNGAQWESGAVGNAEWTGVRLADILARAAVKESATEIVLEGADRGEVKERPNPPGKISFARSLPIEKARDGDVLLAYKMNGEDLSATHGFPLRAIVPGWYGMASIKWLTRIVAIENNFNGYFQTSDYAYWEARDNLPFQLKPITESNVKAVIARPALHEVIPANTTYRVHGAAWAGDAEVTQVEISADGGETWTQARLLGNAIQYAWRLWEFDWQTPSRAGNFSLMSRATDARGRAQSKERDETRGTYMINHTLPVDVEVR